MRENSVRWFAGSGRDPGRLCQRRERPVTTGAYFMGEFNANSISYDSSWTPQQLAASMPNGIFLKNAIIAADPSTATPVQP